MNIMYNDIGEKVHVVKTQAIFAAYSDWLHSKSLQSRHNVCDGVSNHQPHDCILNCLYKAHIKENIKAPHHWPLWGEFTGDRWIPRTKGQWREKSLHLMTSSWFKGMRFYMNNIFQRQRQFMPAYIHFPTFVILQNIAQLCVSAFQGRRGRP